MPKLKPLPSLEKVKELLSYDPLTGVFTWRKWRVHNAAAGDMAGYSEKNGYTVIRISRSVYKAHRLAWLYMTGEDPGQMEVDHKNNLTWDNRFSNLRLTDRSGQNHNRSLNSNSSTGVKGLTWSKTHQKWVGRVMVKKKTYSRYSLNREEIVEWLEVTRKTLHGDMACSG